MAVQDRLYTAQDLSDMPDDGKIYELHNGVLVEVAGSARKQTRLAAWLAFLITNFIMENHPGGEVSGADGTYVLSRYNTRIPDVAYISAGRLKDQKEDAFYQGAPDLAIEVVSPSNTPTEMQERAGLYLDTGSRLVWIVDAKSKTVDVYREDGKRISIRGDGVLEGYDVLPALHLPLSTVFNPFQESAQ
ncbi:MAG TPA: Uma2 family endonuclease [Aggregatilineales bacterium]|nr:Uma2 family endonuclease [Aggregatilineales bacterium]